MFKDITFDCEVSVVDMMMGTGKTSSAINYINSHPEEKFIFITPYIDEVDRIIKFCPKLKFKQPRRMPNKLTGIDYLIEKGENIASTHALFSLFDRRTIDLCRARNYTLIMDEVSKVVDTYKINKEDFNILKEKFVDIEEDGSLTWRNPNDDYNGKFYKEKRLCDIHGLSIYKGSILMWMFPIEAFNAFRKIFILTYLFDAQVQRYYYDYYGLQYKKIYVAGNSQETYHFTDIEEEKQIVNYDFRNIIHILENEKMNQIGDRETDLSKSWYIRNENNFAMKQLKNNITNFFKNIRNTPTGLNLWTSFKDFKQYLTGNGYGRSFIPTNSRATNKFKERISVAYPVNRFLDTCVKNFFIDNEIRIDEEGYALSEMIQWIWRSAIREGNEIWIYIPSSRMRRLLKKWIEEISNEGEHYDYDDEA